MKAAIEYAQPSTRASGATAVGVLAAISVSHLLNDTIQSLIPSIYPILKTSFRSNFSQVGLIALDAAVDRVAAAADRRDVHRPAADAVLARRSAWASRSSGWCCCRSPARSARSCSRAALVGVGSSVFHPESSRMARMASGGRHGLAQSLFQVGGNVGSSLGPLLAAFVVVPYGQAQPGVVLASRVVAMVLLLRVGHWSAHIGRRRRIARRRAAGSRAPACRAAASSCALLVLAC